MRCPPRSNGTELPPRARRIHMILPFLENVNGTTSACAENTLVAWLPKWICGNYLRVRGEYVYQRAVGHNRMELPPRARRILLKQHLTALKIGTTSACAENTAVASWRPKRCWNYLRVRGEYRHHAKSCPPLRELPPRARRIPDSAGGGHRYQGTTSACAENTNYGI